VVFLLCILKTSEKHKQRNITISNKKKEKRAEIKRKAQLLRTTFKKIELKSDTEQFLKNEAQFKRELGNPDDRSIIKIRKLESLGDKYIYMKNLKRALICYKEALKCFRRNFHREEYYRIKEKLKSARRQTEGSKIRFQIR